MCDSTSHFPCFHIFLQKRVFNFLSHTFWSFLSFLSKIFSPSFIKKTWTGHLYSSLPCLTYDLNFDFKLYFHVLNLVEGSIVRDIFSCIFHFISGLTLTQQSVEESFPHSWGRRGLLGTWEGKASSTHFSFQIYHLSEKNLSPCWSQINWADKQERRKNSTLGAAQWSWVRRYQTHSFLLKLLLLFLTFSL